MSGTTSGITFSGLASGLATDDIVSKLMAVERQPIDDLNTQKTNEATKLEAYDQLNTTLTDLQTAVAAMNITSDVRTTKASLSSNAPFTATLNDAATGSYSVAVEQLAQVQKDVSTGYDSQTTGFFNSGTLTINDTTDPSNPKALAAISIDPTNNSLLGIKAAINAQSGTTGVTAAIINDGKSTGAYHLVLTGKDASTVFSLTSASTTSSGTDLSTTNFQVAKQAKVLIDGTEVVSNSNTLANVYNGVTLNLNATSPTTGSGTSLTYTPTEMDIVADPGTLKDKISTFVTSYNKVIDWINQGYVVKTAAETAAAKAAGQVDVLSDYLRGDATVRSIKQSLQSILTNSVGNSSNSLHTLNDIGISTNKDGTLTMDSTKVDDAVTNNLDGLVSLLAGSGTTDGVMKKFNAFLVTTEDPTQGMYATQKADYTTKAAQIDADIAQKEPLMTQMEATLRARFTAMETLVSTLNAQSSYLTQVFGTTSSSTTSSSSTKA